MRETLEADFGTLSKEGDLSVLHYRRELAQPRAKVWRALTEAKELEGWFPTTIEGALEPGSALVFSFRDMDLAPMHGKVLAVEAPGLLEFMWGDDRVRFELSEDGEASTVLAFTVWFPEHGKGARDGAGWHVCLDALDAVVAGRTLPEVEGQRWRQVHPEYVARLGPEASTLGPPQEWQDEHGPA